MLMCDPPSPPTLPTAFTCCHFPSPQLCHVACPRALLTAPLKDPLLQLLVLERKCFQW